MRKLMFMPAACLLCLAICLPAGAIAEEAVPAKEEEAKPTFDVSKSLLKNPTLVAEPFKNHLPRFWSGTVNWKKDQLDMLKIEEDKEVLFEDKPTTRVTFGPFEEPTWFQLLQNIDWKQTDLRGKKVRLTFHVLRDAPRPEGQAYDFLCQVRLPKTDPETRKSNYSRPVAFSFQQKTEPGEWRKVVVEGKVDAEASFFNFQMQGQLKQTQFWFTGFLLEVVEEE